MSGTSDPRLLQSAISAAQAALLTKQTESGAWFAASDMGPVCTAQVLTVLHWVQAISPSDSEDSIRWLKSQQREDGSFVAYPFAKRGSLGATASAWAAFASAGLPQSDPALVRARAFVEENGGIPELREKLFGGELSLLFLVMAGEVSPEELPTIPMGWIFARPVVRFLEKRVHAGVLLGGLQLAAISRRLQGKWGPGGKKKPTVDSLACKRLLTMLAQWQNADGSINGNSLQTAIGLAAFHAVGISRGDRRVSRAIKSLLASRKASPQGSWFFAFEADVWTTALNVRALMASGLSPRDPRIERAIDYLLSCQSTKLQPLVNQRRPGAARVGGWAFQKQNTTMVDCDDTGMVLGILATCLEHGEGMDPKRALRVRKSIERGSKWLRGMQNPDGGWSAFVWGLTPRRSGPIMSEVAQPLKKLGDGLRWLASPPPEMSDPSTEDVTARVLYGLGRASRSDSQPEIERGLAFLRHHQRSHGEFWGRWVVNYLPSTGYAIAAAAALDLPRDTVWVKRAIEFVLSRQNPDGGFGETELSYRDPSAAGVGASTPPLTAILLGALIDIGLGKSPAAEAAARYLLATQKKDGTWSGEDYLATFVPPESFYEYPATVDYAPLEALAKYEDQKISTVSSGKYSDAFLDEAALRVDPLADRAVAAAEREGIALGRLMIEVGEGVVSRIAAIFDGKPLPAEVREYLEASQVLPSWADPKKLATASEFFRKNSFAAGNALFFATLPQSYASAEGARVLHASYGLAGGTRQRIIQTSDFVYAVLTSGALRPGGAAIRFSQRVRLGHAAVRLRLKNQSFPQTGSRPPIHQEHLLGTTLLLSAAVLEALERLGVQILQTDAEAWTHLWNVVGALLGTEPELLPKDAGEARMLLERTRARHWAPSPEGRELAQALVKSAQDYVRLPGLAVSMIRHLSGDACADLLGLEPSDWTRRWIELAVANHEALPSQAMFTDMAFFSTRTIMRAQSLALRGAKTAKRALRRGSVGTRSTS